MTAVLVADREEVDLQGRATRARLWAVPGGRELGLLTVRQIRYPQVILAWDNVSGSPASWRCTCGVCSAVVPMSGAVLRAALAHQTEHIAEMARSAT